MKSLLVALGIVCVLCILGLAVYFAFHLTHAYRVFQPGQNARTKFEIWSLRFR